MLCICYLQVKDVHCTVNQNRTAWTYCMGTPLL